MGEGIIGGREGGGKHFFQVLVSAQDGLATPRSDHLIGQVVKASASRAEDSGFESGLRQDFFGIESYQ